MPQRLVLVAATWIRLILESRMKKTAYFATVPPQEILPIVDGRYESSVKGLFVIGDVTGLPLVKVAANQGREVIERMEKVGLFKNSSELEGLDLVIVGGGPAGISAAIESEKRGLKYVVLERSELANTVRTFPMGKKVYAEPQTITNISELDVDRDLDRDDFLEIVEQTVVDRNLKYKEGVEVSKIQKIQDRQFEVHTKDGKTFPARQVLIAIGRQGQPRKLKIEGCDDCAKVTYRLHTREDYNDEDVMVVGGGNSAIEAALMLKDHNRVTISYRGDDFFRAKEENRRLLDEAIADGSIKAILNSNIIRSRDGEVDLDIGGTVETIKNDKVIILIGTLPPIEFLMDTGMELDGIWNKQRVIWSIVGILIGIFLYFGAKSFVLHPGDADGQFLWPQWLSIFDPNSKPISFLLMTLAPIVGVLTLGARIVQHLMTGPGKNPPYRVPATKLILSACLALFVLGMISPGAVTSDPMKAGDGPYFLDLSLKQFNSDVGVESAFNALSPGFKNEATGSQGRGARYFSNLSGIYYLLYFGLIGVFGIYWAIKSNSKIIWKRNLTIIACQWTLWWGIPTFLVALFGRSAIAPVLKKSLNAWPLNMSAFKVNPVAGPGDPEWWHMVGIVGVVWAVVLTFIIIPLFTIRYGKIYCSYICSCGALAETVGNGFRHRGPKGDLPRKIEKYGYIFILLATIATIADLFGWQPVLWVTGKGPFRLDLFGWYDIWVGTFLAGAMAIGLYPFLGQRIWCRMWCPLAFWMNFWGRWSKFKITPEKGKCIDCNVCNQFCQMGIDIKSRALRGEPVTLVDTPCVGCQECIVRCPMQILHLGDGPQQPALVQLGGTPSMTSGSNA
jgi:thioredoxin reductase/Pyruvate/2-oxoacid:ferredoxin oxidoreductase delta subunit